MWLNSKTSESDTEPLDSTGREMNMNTTRSNFKDSLGVLQAFYFQLSKEEVAYRVQC